jgi:hypothetical protein
MARVPIGDRGKRQGGRKLFRLTIIGENVDGFGARDYKKRGLAWPSDE